MLLYVYVYVQRLVYVHVYADVYADVYVQENVRGRGLDRYMRAAPIIQEANQKASNNKCRLSCKHSPIEENTLVERVHVHR